MKIRTLLTVALLLFSAVVPLRTLADNGSAGPVTYANGDVATATTTNCKPGDVCAKIQLGNGDEVQVLTGSSGLCNPYIMTFMRYSKGQLAAVWSSTTDRYPDSTGGFSGTKCVGFRNTHMKVDGIIDMGVFQNRDGTVFVQFFPAQ